ncbi:hypothetical protein [Salinicoccus sp. HZC-1]|uniref:hypothetical protein n=1 Tax=Salinicoccus sp. HZC-1 TaxID=3385497 RepID=UPI00398BB262
MTAIIDKNKMRNINHASELIFKTFGIDSMSVKLKKLEFTDMHTRFIIEWTGLDVSLDATVKSGQIKDKWVRSKYDVEFEAEQHERLKHLQNELYNQDDINDDVFEDQEYDPARGYVEKDKADEQEALELDREETE